MAIFDVPFGELPPMTSSDDSSWGLDPNVAWGMSADPRAVSQTSFGAVLPLLLAQMRGPSASGALQQAGGIDLLAALARAAAESAAYDDKEGMPGRVKVPPADYSADPGILVPLPDAPKVDRQMRTRLPDPSPPAFNSPPSDRWRLRPGWKDT